MLSINRSSRSARLLAALGATIALAGGMSAALAAQDAHAMPCELRGTQTQKACTDFPDTESAMPGSSAPEARYEP